MLRETMEILHFHIMVTSKMEVDLLFPTIFFIMETIEGTNLEH